MAPKTFRGELLGAAAVVHVIAVPHPLSPDRMTFDLPAGLSVAEIVDASLAKRRSGMRRDAVVYVGGELVPGEWWPRVRVKPGVIVVVQARVAGGKANVLIATVLTIVVAIAAVALAGPLLLGLGLVGLGTSIAAGSALGIAITGAVAAGITVAGALAINALFPVRPTSGLSDAISSASSAASVDASNPTYAIGGSQNQRTPFGPVPALHGQHRISPNYGAAPYTEIVGDDQYLRLLFIWGYGPMDIADLKIGETPLSAFTDVEIETRNGYATDAPLTLFSDDVFQQDLAVDLVTSVAQTQVTAASVDEISVDVTAPSGIYRYQSGNGKRVPYTVVVHVRYATFPGGVFVDAGDITLTSSATTAARRALRWTVPNGQYTVEMTRTTPAYVGADTVSEDVVWTALRAWRESDPVQFPIPVAKTALRIKASAQLSGVIDTFNGVCTARVTAWDSSPLDDILADADVLASLDILGSSWTLDTPSRDPAAAFRAVLQGPANTRTVADALIDLEALQDWSAYCSANGFTFDQLRDQVASVYSTLSDVAAAGRAVPVFKNGLWSVMWDQPNAPIVQHFTPRNSANYSGSRSYSRKPDGFRVAFINAAKGWLQDERIVYDDGFDETNGRVFEQIQFPGVTDADLVWRHGRFHIAQARLRPEQYAINVNWQALVCTRGDRVLLSHDVPEFGLGFGRVKSIAGLPTVVLDDAVTMLAGQSYCIRFRLADGTSSLRNVATAAGTTNVLVMSDFGTDPAVGDLWMFGLVGSETVAMRVLSVEPAENETALVTLVDDAPAISAADTGPIPAFDSHISTPIDPFAQPPRNLTVQEQLFPEFDSLRSGAFLTWDAPQYGSPTTYEVQYLLATGDGTWLPGGTVAAPLASARVIDLDTGLFTFRVRALFAFGQPSTWAVSDPILITGVNVALTSALPDVLNFVSSYVANITYLDWTEVDDPRSPIFYEIRLGDTWDAGQVLGQYAHQHVPAIGNGTYWIKGVYQLATGLSIYSVLPTGLAIEGSILADYVVGTFDEELTGWPGTESGDVIFDGTFPRTFGGGDTLAADDVLAIADVYAFGDQGSGYYTAPASHVIDAGRVCPCLIQITYSGSGISSAADFFAPADFFASDADIFGSAANQLVDVHPEIAVSQDGTTWGPWQRFNTGTYVGRAFWPRMVLASLDPNTVTYLTAMAMTVSVPARVDNFVNLAVGAGGTSIVFTPDNDLTPAPLHSGPGSAGTPMVQVTILNATAGDDAVVSSLTLTGCTVQVLNGGIGVARHCNIQVSGF